MTAKSIPCACAVKLWTRSRFTDRKPVSLSEHCDDPSRSRSPGSAGGARIHQTLESKTLPLQKKREKMLRPPSWRLYPREIFSNSPWNRRAEPPSENRVPTAGYTRASGCVLPERSLAPSPSLSRSRSPSRRFSLQLLGTRLWRLAANLKATSPGVSAWLGWHRHQEAAQNFGWFPHHHQKLVQNTARTTRLAWDRTLRIYSHTTTSQWNILLLLLCHFSPLLLPPPLGALALSLLATGRGTEQCSAPEPRHEAVNTARGRGAGAGDGKRRQKCALDVGFKTVYFRREGLKLVVITSLGKVD